MAKGPRYRQPFRRRVEGKTDYRKRLKLLKSKKLRIVIRASNNHIGIQFIQSKLKGDLILVSAYSKELTTKYEWTANTGNVPAAYLTGYLAGLRAKKKGITEGVLDLGMIYHRNRVLAAFKGVLSAGIEVPYNEEFFPESMEERIKGTHIENYAKVLKNEDPEKYERMFSGYIKNKKLNPLKLTQMVSNLIQKIENNA